jgi:hypothetical protein
MKLLNIETPVTRNFIPQILLNVQDFYFHKLAIQVMTKASSDLRQSIIEPLTGYCCGVVWYKVSHVTATIF